MTYLRVTYSDSHSLWESHNTRYIYTWPLSIILSFVRHCGILMPNFNQADPPEVKEEKRKSTTEYIYIYPSKNHWKCRVMQIIPFARQHSLPDSKRWFRWLILDNETCDHKPRRQVLIRKKCWRTTSLSVQPLCVNFSDGQYEVNYGHSARLTLFELISWSNEKSNRLLHRAIKIDRLP